MNGVIRSYRDGAELSDARRGALVGIVGEIKTAEREALIRAITKGIMG